LEDTLIFFGFSVSHGNTPRSAFRHGGSTASKKPAALKGKGAQEPDVAAPTNYRFA
jgi:hypothetical protein